MIIKVEYQGKEYRSIPDSNDHVEHSQKIYELLDGEEIGVLKMKCENEEIVIFPQKALSECVLTFLPNALGQRTEENQR